MSFYASYPVEGGGGGITTYATFSAFPPGTTVGQVALAQDTEILYAWNGSIWEVIGGPGVPISATAYSVLGNNTSSTAPAANLQSITLGTPSYSDSGILAQITTTSTGYAQQIIQNKSNNAAASADFIVGNNLNTASTYYGDFGINSSTFSGTGSLSLPNATYLYSQNGDLSIGTASSNALHLVVNSGATDALTIASSGTITIPSFTTAGYVTTTSGGLLGSAAAGNLTDVGTDGITVTGGTGALLSSASIAQAAATSSQNGYLKSSDWTTFNSKGSGTVTAVSVASLNGFAGTSSGGATPALTLTTSITGILQGNGTAISAASTTGSGAVVLANTPTLITPVLGAATGTSLQLSGLTASQAVVTDASKNLTSLTYTSVNTGSSLASRDAAGNASFNVVIETETLTVTSGQTIAMTYGSAETQRTSGTSGCTFTLPDATTLITNWTYHFNNNSTAAITVNNYGGSLIVSVPGGGFADVICVSNGVSNGTWDVHNLLASAATSGTSGTSLPGSLTVTGLTTAGPVSTTSGGLLSSTAYLPIGQGGTGNSTGTATVTSVGNATSLTANGITLASMAQAPTLTLQGNNTGGTANIANLTVAQVTSMLGSTTPTASTLAEWDTNKNLSAANHIEGYSTTATAAGTTTLVVGSNWQQFFTGTTTQTVLLPVTSTLVLGQSFQITNNSTGVVTVQSSGANNILAMPANTVTTYTCILTSGTTAASWSASTSAAASVLAPTIQKFTSGSGTYTTPTSPRVPLYIRVILVGGGGGGSGSGTTGGGNGTTGGTTSFGTSLLSATGGVYGVFTGGAAGGAGGAGSLGSGPIGTVLTGGTGDGSNLSQVIQYLTGGRGGNTALGGGAGAGPANAAGIPASSNTGGGGSGAGTAGVTSDASGCGGGGGGFVDAIISSPLATYAYAVGAAGGGGTAGTSGFAGGAGGSGYIEVREYYQ